VLNAALRSDKDLVNLSIDHSGDSCIGVYCQLCPLPSNHSTTGYACWYSWNLLTRYVWLAVVQTSTSL
jgi:hypothetical protein